MIAALASMTGADPLSLLEILERDYRIFDSIWYRAMPALEAAPEEAGDAPEGPNDIDRMLHGVS